MLRVCMRSARVFGDAELSFDLPFGDAAFVPAHTLMCLSGPLTECPAL